MTIIQRFSLFFLLSTSVSGFSTCNRASLRLPSSSLAASTVVEEGVSATSDAAEVLAETKSWNDDGFVFGLKGSGLERPKGKVSQVVVEGDTLEVSDSQRAIVWSTLLGHAGISAFSIMGMMAANEQALGGALAGNEGMLTGFTAIQAMAVVGISWLSADFGSGVLHWSVDNYGNGKTPVMGGIIAAFQGHHSAPWTITERGFENNVSKLCIPFGIQTVIAMKLIFGLGPAATLFWSFFCVMEVMSQEFHKMSHTTKGEAGPVWNALQDVGLTLNRKSHAQHHIAPYDGNYCIVSGRCNKIMDESGLFRRMEHVVYNLNGIEANSWKLDAKLRERTLNGEYELPKKAGR